MAQSARISSVPIAITNQSATTRTAVDVSKFANMSVQVAYDASFAGTVKVYGSLQSTEPNVSSAVSQSNEYFPLAIADFTSDSVIAGGTGYTVVAASAGIIAFDTQAILLKWVVIEVVRTAGTYDMTYMVANNG